MSRQADEIYFLIESFPQNKEEHLSILQDIATTYGTDVVITEEKNKPRAGLPHFRTKAVLVLPKQ